MQETSFSSAPPPERSLFDLLPNDLLREVLLGRLDGVTSVVSRFVCKRFASLIPNYPWLPKRDRFCEEVAERGDLNLLQWARLQGAPWDIGYVYGKAAQARQIEVLQWVRTKDPVKSLSVDIWKRVAFCGDLNLLLWARANGAPWDQHMYSKAAYEGDLSLLQWLHTNGAPLQGDDSACDVAASKGDRKKLEWLRAHGATWGQKTYTRALSHGHRELLPWLHEKGAPLNTDDEVCATAAFKGDFPSLQWLHARGAPVAGPAIAHAAALSGDLAMLQWGLANGVTMDPEVSKIAAERGHLTLLQVAHESGAELHYDTCARAARNGHFEVVRWAHEHGAPIDERVCQSAAERGDLATLQWAKEHGAPWFCYYGYEHTVCRKATEGGHLELLRWARANGAPCDVEDCLRIAAERKDHEMVAWLETIRGDTSLDDKFKQLKA